MAGCPMRRQLAAAAVGVVAVGLLAGSAYSAPTACAVPGDPMQNCATYGLGGVVCDGPIRPDGTWKRCTRAPGYCSGNICNGPTTYCAVIDPGQPLPPLMMFTPPNHIN